MKERTQNKRCSRTRAVSAQHSASVWVGGWVDGGKMPAEKQCADECAICLEPMKYPAALHCGHAMDSTCLMKVPTRASR